jgi:hypothetical protein
MRTIEHKGAMGQVEDVPRRVRRPERLLYGTSALARLFLIVCLRYECFYLDDRKIVR